MPLEHTVSLEAIADLTVGMVGADLKAVCQKAAYTALRRQVSSLQDSIPDTMTVAQEDFLQALRQVKPSVLRSVEVESPDQNSPGSRTGQVFRRFGRERSRRWSTAD